MVDPRARILYLAGAEVREVCAALDPVATVKQALILHALGETTLPDEAYLEWTNGRDEKVRSLSMPGFVGGEFRSVGTKVINSNPHNIGRRVPRADGVTLLFDPDTGRVQCIMEGAYISSIRTASVTTVAAEALSGPAIDTVAVIGAGVLATAHAEVLFPRLRRLRTVRLFDLIPARVEALATRCRGELGSRGVHVEVAPSAEAAIRGAQLVVAVTTTTTGYICADWLVRGAVLVNVSLDDPLPEVVLRADRVFVDDWGLVATDGRRLIGRMYRQGLVVGPDDCGKDQHENARRVDGTLGDVLVRRKPGRHHDGETILFNPFGMAIEDVVVAGQVYHAALARGLGTWLAK
jgi:ornithine cyclodeaminase/alanine dehydrogenase-like protein (mu-crystallin family)